MNSIFDEPDRNEEALIQTKVRLEDIRVSDLKILKEGPLRMRTPDNEFKDGYFVLLYDRLIYFDS